MACEQNKLKISLLIDGQLPDEEAAPLRSHIGICEKCARYLEDLQIVRNVLKLTPGVAVSPSFHKRLGARLRREGTGRYTAPIMVRMWVRRAIAAGIVAAILIAAVLILSSLSHENGAPARLPGEDKHVAKEPPEERPGPRFVSEGLDKPAEHPEGTDSDVPTPPEPEGADKLVEDVPPDKIAPESPPEIKAPRDVAVRKEKVPPAPEVPAPGEGLRTVERTPEEKTPAKLEEATVPLDLRRFEQEFLTLVKKGDTNKQIEMLRSLSQSPGLRTYKLFKRVLVTHRKKVKPAIRREALFTLADIGTDQAVGIVLSIVPENDWQVSDVVPEALARIKRSGTLNWLATEVLSSASSAEVRRVVAEALAHVQAHVPQEPLGAALAREPEVKVRVAICDTLGAVGDSGCEDVLIRRLQDKSWVVRDAALRALSRVGTMKCVPEVIRRLNDTSARAAHVREAAARVLCENPDVRAVEPLVRQLKHKDPRLRGAVLRALWRITGKRFMKQSEWRAWLKETGPYPETNANPTATPPAPSSFLGIGLWTKKVLYLVDASCSMRQRGKLEEAKQLIKESIKHLPEETMFNVIFFSTIMRAFSPTKFQRADAHTKARTYTWLDKVRLPVYGMTNFYDTLVSAVKMEPDDVILVTDGLPTEGTYLYPPKIVREIADLNLTKKIRIHTVGFYTLRSAEGVGEPIPVGPTVEFLRNLAARNYGEFRYRWFELKSGGE